MQSEAKKRSEKMQGCGRKNSGVDFLRGGSFVYCDMGDASRADAGGKRTGCCASRCENNVYDLTVAANCDEIKDAEAFAEKVVQKYEENSFRTTKFSVDLGEDIDLVRFHVYLRREEIGEKEELFQIRYQDGDIILDGINGKR